MGTIRNLLAIGGRAKSIGLYAVGLFDWKILLILSISLTVRVWGVGFGLPNTEALPDESFIVNTAIKFGTGDLNPHNFFYGTLYMYCLFILFGVYFVVGLATGKYPSPQEFMIEYVVDPSNFYLTGRLFNAVMGTITVFVVFRLAHFLFGRRVALVAATFLGLAYLHVRNSHFGKTDIMLTLWICCAFLFIARAYREGRLIHYGLAGLFSGLAISTKYFGLLLITPTLVAHALTCERLTWSTLWLSKRLCVYALSLVAASIITMPYMVLDWQTFLSDVTTQSFNASSNFHVPFVAIGWWHHLTFNLYHGLGFPLLIASLVGSVILIARDWKLAIVLLSLSILYYSFVGGAQAVFSRYMVPIIPSLCLAAAVGVDVLATAFTRTKLTGLVLAIVSAMVLLPSVSSILQMNSLLSQVDNRLLAADWVNSNVPSGSSIYQVGDRAASLKLEPTLESLLDDYAALVAAGEAGSIEARALTIKIADRAHRLRNGYSEWLYDDQANYFITRNGTVMHGLPDYVILFEYPAIPYNQPTPHSLDLVNKFYTLVQTFPAVDLQVAERNAYDVQDAFYLPYSGFAGVSRPGPNVSIYALNRFSSAPVPFVPDSRVR